LIASIRKVERSKDKPLCFTLFFEDEALYYEALTVVEAGTWLFT